MRKVIFALAAFVLISFAAEGQDIRALAKEVGKELQNILSDEDDVYA